MKICFIVGAYPTMKCGVGDYTSVLAEELAKKGNEVHVITSDRASNKSQNVVVHNIVKEWKLSAIKPIVKELKRIKPDVVNIEYPSDEYFRITVTLLPPIIKRSIKCKVTITIHEYDYFDTSVKKSLKDKIRLYLNFHKLDTIISVEKQYIERIKRDCPKGNIVHIPISSNIPKSNAEKEELKELKLKYGIDDKKVISYFGFSTKTKGIEYLLKCMPKLEEDVKLLYINELDEKNDYHKSLLDLMNELNIQDRVIITGFIDKPEDVANILSISDVCVLPFVNGLETRNGSFLAAYNQNIRIITTSKNNEIDENGIYFVKPQNQEELLDKIKYVLEDTRDFERKELTWDEVTNEYFKVFE